MPRKAPRRDRLGYHRFQPELLPDQLTQDAYRSRKGWRLHGASVAVAGRATEFRYYVAHGIFNGFRAGSGRRAEAVMDERRKKALFAAADGLLARMGRLSLRTLIPLLTGASVRSVGSRRRGHARQGGARFPSSRVRLSRRNLRGMRS